MPTLLYTGIQLLLMDTMEVKAPASKGSINLLVVGLVTALLVVLAMPMVGKILSAESQPSATTETK